ncbi:MAG: response regulator transcription factor [Dehalococcoidia bacterium]|nr:response regulator transcription factor [Dehalococcoidia bacterium]
MNHSDIDRPGDSVMAAIKVLLVDDHPLIRQAVRSILEKEKDICIVGEAVDGEQAIEMAGKLSPAVVMMDYNMPGMNGLEATTKIKEKYPAISVLMLTVLDDDHSIRGIMQAGASGYLVKSVFGQEVVQAVRAVAVGDMVLSPAIGRKLVSQASRHPLKPVRLDDGEKLSVRELEVLKLAASGMSNKEIAADLGINLRTVKGHFTDIFTKLGVSSRTEAVTTGLRSGFLTIDDTK